jgi:hypothetical protein
MNQSEVRNLFNDLGANVVFVDMPVFWIGLNVDTKQWEQVLYPDTDPDGMKSKNKNYSIIKPAAVATISLDGGRIVDNNYTSSPATRLLTTSDEASLLKSWIITMAARLKAIGKPTLFLRDIPKVINLDLKVISAIDYEEAAMNCGVDEMVFSIKMVEDYKTRHVFGRVYYEGMIIETPVSVKSEKITDYEYNENLPIATD